MKMHHPRLKVHFPLLKAIPITNVASFNLEIVMLAKRRHSHLLLENSSQFTLIYVVYVWNFGWFEESQEDHHIMGMGLLFNLLKLEICKWFLVFNGVRQVCCLMSKSKVVCQQTTWLNNQRSRWENACHPYWLAHWIDVESFCLSILYCFLWAKKLLILIHEAYCSFNIPKK